MVGVLTQVGILSVKCEIFYPLSLGKWISEQAAKYPSTTIAAGAAAASSQMDLLQNFDLAAKH